MLMKHKNNDLPYIHSNQNIFDQAEARLTHGPRGCHVLIPHVCNNINGFGAGFAADVASRYPVVKENFHLLGKDARLGYVQFITVKEDKQYKYRLVFANMISQNGIYNAIKNKRPLHYPSLIKCMEKVGLFAQELYSQTEGSRVEIHAPRFGSGLAGGNWDFITDLIQDIWRSNEVFVYSKGKNL
jgi:hypothetical protein